MTQAVERDGSSVRSARSWLTSDSRNRRCPPGVRIDPIRPAEAQRVTVFGSTLNISATSPGVSNRSGISMGRDATGGRCQLQQNSAVAFNVFSRPFRVVRPNRRQPTNRVRPIGSQEVMTHL